MRIKRSAARACQPPALRAEDFIEHFPETDLYVLCQYAQELVDRQSSTIAFLLGAMEAAEARHQGRQDGDLRREERGQQSVSQVERTPP